MPCKIATMVSKTFSEQRGGLLQKSLKAFKRVMRLCGSDLVGVIKHTRCVLNHSSILLNCLVLMENRLGKTLAPSLRDKRTDTLLSLLGKLVASAPSSTRRQWYSIVKSYGFGRSELVENHRIFNME